MAKKSELKLMIAIELYVNDKKVATGAVKHGVMSAIINWVRVQKNYEESDSWMSSVSLGGLDDETSENLKWFRQNLSIGDEVRIRLTESDKIDPPLAREPKTAVKHRAN